jgi:hypothetical protein
MTVGISISLYNKFNDLGILLDIVRHNWEQEYYVSVCSNHPDAHDRIGPYEDRINHFEQGDQISYDPSDEYSFRNAANRWYRVYDTISTACNGALADDNVDYVMHFHADAWQLSEDALYGIIGEMEAEDASVAFKIQSDTFEQHRVFPDQFWLIDANDARDVGFFQWDALDFPPRLSTHQILPMLCLAHFGWGGIYQYSTRADGVHWDGMSVLEAGNAVRPMLYSPKHHHVHIANEDFPEGLGKSLQVHYLDKYGLDDGEHIESLFAAHQMPKDELFDRLDRYLSDLNSQLRWYGLSVDDFGRDMRKILPLIEQPMGADKLKNLVRIHTEGTIAGEVLEAVYTKLTQNSTEAENGGLKTQFLRDYYQEQLALGDYPEETIAEGTVISDRQTDDQHSGS